MLQYHRRYYLIVKTCERCKIILYYYSLANVKCRVREFKRNIIYLMTFEMWLLYKIVIVIIRRIVIVIIRRSNGCLAETRQQTTNIVCICNYYYL